MVMDATQPQQPSPQSVGREFVRQYYTLLNKAPNHLHRFYTNYSSFIHGESTLVVGQTNIHNRIQQLNFRDCHAKISQVDAQVTLGNGVVVQVTGELSNDGQPMRRFTQTFVLAAQTPKKYYVHNDIFRYQDMYTDDENEGEVRSENGEEHEQATIVAGGGVCKENQPIVGVISEQQPQQQPMAAQVIAGGTGVLPPQQQAQAGALPQQPIYYSMPASGGRPVQVLAPPQGAAVALGAQFVAAGGAGVVPPQQVPAGVTQLNGVVAHEDLLAGLQQPNVVPQTLVAQSGSPVMQATGAVPVATSVLTAQQNTTGPVAGLPAPMTTTVGIAQSGMPGFQPSALMQQQLLQQPPPQQQQQPISTPPAQAPLLQSQMAPNMDGEDSISMTLPANAKNSNDSTPRSTAVAATPAAASVVNAAPVVDDFKTINEQQQQEKYEATKQQQQMLNEPKTYANLFKSSPSPPAGFMKAALEKQQQQIQQQQQQQQTQQQQQQSTNNSYPTSGTISTATFSQSTSGSINLYNNRNNDNTSTLRMDNNNMGVGGQGGAGGPLPQRSNTSRVNKDFDQRRPSNTQFVDNQQLFLGNIPHHASEEDLKSLFARFGNILELRILSKPSGKMPPGVRNPLNYGFITYEDAESVQNCLANCPLYFPDTPDGQKLNVEEKKPRMRSDMPSRQSMGNNMNNNMSNSQRNNMGGGPARSITNSGGMMRGNNGNGNNMSRGSAGGGGPRLGGAFNRNDNRSNNGPVRGGGGGSNNAQSGGGNYGSRR